MCATAESFIPCCASLTPTAYRAIAGANWEGFVVETLLRAAPERAQASFYRAAAGAEIDLVMELPGDRIWAMEIKRGLAPSVGKGFRAAFDDVRPDKAFLVHGGSDRYPKGGGVEAVGLMALAREPEACAV